MTRHCLFIGLHPDYHHTSDMADRINHGNDAEDPPAVRLAPLCELAQAGRAKPRNTTFPLFLSAQ